MSRTRARRRGGFGADENGFFPAERAAIVNLEDPRGHRMVRIGRYIDPAVDSGYPWFDRKTIRPTDLFETEPAIGEPTRLWFTCRACRDQGADPFEAFIDVAVLNTCLDELLVHCRADGIPRTTRLAMTSPASE